MRSQLLTAPLVLKMQTLGDFTFWISLSLSPKFGLSPKLSQKVKSIFLFKLRSERKTERITESEVWTKVG